MPEGSGAPPRTGVGTREGAPACGHTRVEVAWRGQQPWPSCRTGLSHAGGPWATADPPRPGSLLQLLAAHIHAAPATSQRPANGRAPRRSRPHRSARCEEAKRAPRPGRPVGRPPPPQLHGSTRREPSGRIATAGPHGTLSFPWRRIPDCRHHRWWPPRTTPSWEQQAPVLPRAFRFLDFVPYPKWAHSRNHHRRRHPGRQRPGRSASGPEPPPRPSIAWSRGCGPVAHRPRILRAVGIPVRLPPPPRGAHLLAEPGRSSKCLTSLHYLDGTSRFVYTALMPRRAGSWHGRHSRGGRHRRLRRAELGAHSLPGPSVMLTHLILLGLALLVFVYLGVAMFDPERF